MSTIVPFLRTVTDYLLCLVSIAAAGVSTTNDLSIRLSLMQILHVPMHKARPSDLRAMAGKWQMNVEEQFPRLAGFCRISVITAKLAHALHCA